jgi:predicted nucleic acid-binding protein
MSVIIDTSVWIDHFRNRNDVLVSLLQADLALMHQMVLVELACGTPPAPRARTLGEIALLRACNQASLEEVMHLAEREKLYGLGCGLVDISLLGSALISPGASLWTLDKRLADLAERFGVAFHSKLH